MPAATLSEFTSHLLTIHGQNDQLRLMAPEKQLVALDRVDPGIAPLLAAYRETYNAWRAAAKDLKERTEKKLELAQEVDRLRFAIDEIDAIAPQESEDDELVEAINRLQDVDALREAATEALAAIDGPEAAGGYGGGEDAAASTLVGQAASALDGASDLSLIHI